MNEQVATLLRSYDALLEGEGVGIHRAENLFPGDLSHLRWMIREMFDRALADGWSERKVCRWLGCIQGALWASGRVGILALRDQSRHLYQD